MKIFVQMLMLTIIVGCNSSGDNTSAIEEANRTVPTESKKVEEGSKINLRQHGDYTSLFYAQSCSNIIDAGSISEIVKTKVEQSGNDRFCRFTFWQDGLEMFMTLLINDMSNYNIQKEVKNFMSNPPFLAHEISKTGDSHICRQDSHKRIMIYNTNYTSAIVLSYGVNSGGQITREQKNRLKNLGVDLANQLLLDHKK